MVFKRLGRPVCLQVGMLGRRADGQLRYQYVVTEGCTGDFTLLCEVGVPCQPLFSSRLQRFIDSGYRFVTRELPDRPWMADYLLKPGDPGLPGDQDATWQLEQSKRRRH